MNETLDDEWESFAAAANAPSAAGPSTVDAKREGIAVTIFQIDEALEKLKKSREQMVDDFMKTMPPIPDPSTIVVPAGEFNVMVKVLEKRTWDLDALYMANNMPRAASPPWVKPTVRVDNAAFDSLDQTTKDRWSSFLTKGLSSPKIKVEKK